MNLLILIITPLALFFAPHLQGENKTFNRERSFDVQHYVVRLSFDQANKRVFGDTTIRLTPIKKDFRTLELDATNIRFRSVKLEQRNQSLKYRVARGKIVITLDKPYQPSEKISVRLKYSAKPRKGIYFVEAVRKKGKLVRSSQIWTQGESEETHHWLPSFDFPDDKATTEQFITVKKGFTVVANGELIGKLDGGRGYTTFHYRMPVPHSLYLTSFVVGKYVKVSDTYRGIPLGYYVYPGQKSIVPSAFGKTKEMFRIFEELTGVPYPYNKYDQTIVARFPIGGMENITATTLSDTEVMMARFKFAQGLIEDLVAHELAHSWFGNLVTCRNWAELWLNEGFATFMEAAYREKMYGRNDYIRKIRQDASQYFAFASGLRTKQHGLFNRLADARNDDTMFDAITYQKGSAVIHTLREEIGEEAFWKAVNTYLTKHKFANVETHDLQKTFEASSGRDLDWFFRQWVYAEGYPKIRVSQVYNAGTKTLTLRFRQIQNSDEDTPEAFQLPLEIKVTVAQRPIVKEFTMTRREQTVMLKLDGKPDLLRVDPEMKIPLKIVTMSELSVER